MARRNIYQGPDSCYALHEGIYVAGSGVTPGNVRAFLRLIERDLRRGWTYDHSCRRIRMTPALARKRALYLIALARKHSGLKASWAVREAVLDWLSRVGVSRRRAAAVVA
jgi:hypothetical protein